MDNEKCMKKRELRRGVYWLLLIINYFKHSKGNNFNPNDKKKPPQNWGGEN